MRRSPVDRVTETIDATLKPGAGWTLSTYTTKRPSPLIRAPVLRAGIVPNCPVAWLRLMRSVVPFCTSRTNTSGSPFVSPATRFVAADVKATYRPSSLIDGSVLAPSGGAPAPRLTSCVVPLAWSRTKMSLTPSVSPATRLSAVDSNATYRPSSDSDGCCEGPFPSPPVLDTLERSTWKHPDSSSADAASASPARARFLAMSPPHAVPGG